MSKKDIDFWWDATTRDLVLVVPKGTKKSITNQCLSTIIRYDILPMITIQKPVEVDELERFLKTE